eukprot:3137400-Prymnesium_polylepis.1
MGMLRCERCGSCAGDAIVGARALCVGSAERVVVGFTPRPLCGATRSARKHGHSRRAAALGSVGDSYRSRASEPSRLRKG